MRLQGLALNGNLREPDRASVYAAGVVINITCEKLTTNYTRQFSYYACLEDNDTGTQNTFISRTYDGRHGSISACAVHITATLDAY